MNPYAGGHLFESSDEANSSLPLVFELQPAPDAVDVFQRLADLPHCLFLDSALRRAELGRYSFVCVDPYDFITVTADQAAGSGASAVGTHDVWSMLKARLSSYSSRSVPGIPPFQGGAAGLLSFDLNRSLEKVAPARNDEFSVPALAVGFYDVVVALDHKLNRAWILSQGFPETDEHSRKQRAADRLRQCQDWLKRPPVEHSSNERVGENRLLAGEICPQFPTSGPPLLTSNFSAGDYRQAIQRAVDYIYAGDVFQVNLAQRLLHPAVEDSLAVYLRLRARNPATFAAYFDLGDFQILSASPERFLSIRERLVEARPIKGTRQRTARPEADLFAAADLQQSEKDRAENVMIVDLLRNDLSRVCLPDSVCVTQLFGLEVYEYVQHLVSVVHGELAADVRPLDVIQAAFPGGSITGAPKVRAMEIIAELERTARGPYCGSLGYLGFDESTDFNILIRTITAGRGWWQMPVGGGIVAQSSPQNEYEETWHKARGLLRALPSG